ncbi:MAG: hypothetical protein JNK37_16675 [Verrucomicrobiales bacterium]|nr:hypothetical protein [Verrucomicrobiales bacterium]
MKTLGTLGWALLAGWAMTPGLRAGEAWSGIYPHLAYFNNEGECGTGAVVPWADRLWVITYAPHQPKGSSDKLYEIDAALNLTIRPESVGGTPANRLIHRESNQLFIGPYVIDADRQVRTIPPSRMYGRITGTARHLTDPAGKIYHATMEEGFYEVDVRTLEVTTLYHDEQIRDGQPKAGLPGYHGKGLYSGQGRLIYANNGEHGPEALRNPFVPSGVLAEWDGRSPDWSVVLRHQFTEVTGPGGIYGNEHPETDPVWSVGWDARSLILMLLDGGKWHRFRLPKASHSYDGAHGWNTEWPRIREIGGEPDDDLLMTMHGMLWRFPRTFSAANTSGIAPRSTYLKVVGDFCRWGDRVVFGCDDTAKNEFLNKRKAKGEIAQPQSQSNLWFVDPERLDHIGPVIGRGAVWLGDTVAAGGVSDPYLFAGFQRRALHLAHRSAVPVTFRIEVDRDGAGTWETLREVEVAAGGYRWEAFSDGESGVWVRLTALSGEAKEATAWFTSAGPDKRKAGVEAETFAGMAKPGATAVTGGIVRARGENKRTLHFAAHGPDGDLGLYEMDEKLTLRPVTDATALAWTREHAAIPSREGVIELDAASVIYVDDAGRRFRLPRGGDASFDAAGPLGWERLCREVATERDLFNCHGTFFELPAENAAGFRRVRPVATHGRRISDYCSYRGLFVVSGIDLADAGESRHIIRSTDGRTGLWVGAIDDIWELGKPVGRGGPWLDTPVKAGDLSDPYLMTGYDRKSLTLKASEPMTITAEIDLSGMGDWQTWRQWPVKAGEAVAETFPESFQAYWIRFRTDAAGSVTAQLLYE